MCFWKRRKENKRVLEDQESAKLLNLVEALTREVTELKELVVFGELTAQGAATSDGKN